MAWSPDGWLFVYERYLFRFMAELDDADKREEGDGLKQNQKEAVGGKPQKCRRASALYQTKEADEQDCLWARQPELDKTVRNVAVVADIDGAMETHADDDDGDGVEQRKAEHQQRDEHGGGRRAFVGKIECRQKSRDGKAEAKEVAAAVAHEDFCGRTVVHQKTDGDSACDGGQHGDKMLAADGGDEKEEEGGDGGDAAGQAVHVVKKIEHVDDGDDPQDGDTPAENRIFDEQEDADARCGDATRYHKLPEELELGAERVFVIAHAEDAEGGRPQDDSNHFGEDGVDAVQKRLDPSARDGRREFGDGDAAGDDDEPRGSHAEAAEYGRGGLMGLVGLLFRLVDESQAGGELAA